MLSALKRDLKNLVGQNELTEVLRRLKEEVLNDESSYYNDVIIVEKRIAALEKNTIQGVITFENETITDNSTSVGILAIIDGLELDDLRSDLRRSTDSFVTIPAYHAFAVNRGKQAEKFELDRFLPADPNQKIHFYYLHGDSRQEVQSFVNRLSLERNGRTLSSDGLASGQPGREPVFAACKPEPRDNAVLFHILLLKSLMEKFVGPVNDMNSLRSKTLVDLLASPKLGSLEADDAVCILVTLDDYNWRNNVVGTVLQQLYTSFCKVDLPATAPHFYFFFGIEYQKENEKVRNEVAATIAARQYGEALDELMPVSLSHVNEWFTRHRSMVPPGVEVEELTKQLFADATDELDMIDVETVLKRLIDQHNKGLILSG